MAASDKIVKATDSTTVELSDSHKLLAETGGAALGGLFGLCLAGPLGAVLGAFAGQILTPASERLVAKCIDELRERGRVVAYQRLVDGA
jgi:outer membrane lipoprotein SlyB